MVATEVQHKGEFLTGEGADDISREVAVVASGEVLADGDLIALAASKIVAFTGATDQEAVGISYGAYDATDGDLAGGVYIARLATVKEALVQAQDDDTAETNKAAALAALKVSNFIVAR